MVGLFVLWLLTSKAASHLDLWNPFKFCSSSVEHLPIVTRHLLVPLGAVSFARYDSGFGFLDFGF